MIVDLPQSVEMINPDNDFFSGSGKMVELVNNKDWSITPLGPINTWPQSLKTTVSLCLASNFPIAIAWGPHNVQIYNDGYWPLCGIKHPVSMGQNFKECWFSAWDVLGEAFEEASLGHTRFLENQRMFLDRFGYLEETFFTFSFSPISNESGGVGGIFHPVTDLTQQTLAERRLNLLHKLTGGTADARSTEEATALIMNVLKDAELDLPFLLFYTNMPNGESATLTGAVGLEKGTLMAPLFVDENTGHIYSEHFASVTKSKKFLLNGDLENNFGVFSCGPYPEPPNAALVFPIQLSGDENPHSFLVAGISSRRALDAKYLLFYEMLVAAFIYALTKAKSFEEKRRRVEALEELDKAKTMFFSNVSHEFRTPLTLMLGPLEDALADKTNLLLSVQKERLELVYRNTLRLQKLVNTLLDFSRIEEGRLKAKFQPTNLGLYTSELAGVFRSAMDKAGLILDVNINGIVDPVFVDRDMWEQIVFNLLSNALKFTFEGRVSVHLSEDNGNVLLSVIDTGEGIESSEIGNLFKRFYRIEASRSRTHEGSGIGLALVQELVKLHGGIISAESEKGKGTTFTVSIPKGFAHLPKDQVVQETGGSPKIQTPNYFINESMGWLSAPGEEPGKELIIDDEAAIILVVDDNADMLQYLVKILGEEKNWQIMTASNGLQALKVLEKQKPDLVISDVMMPELDGFQLLNLLKGDLETSRIPVLLLSARAGEEATIEGLNNGADDYLIKPFSARELVARVKNQLKITNTRPDHVKFGEAEARARLAVESAELGTYEINLLTDELIGSQRMAAIFDVDHPADRNHYKTALLQEDLPLRDEAYKKAMQTGILDYEARVSRKDSTITWIRIKGKVYYDNESNATRLLGIVQDITKEKEIGREKDDFISMVSHELRTPITSLKGYAQILMRKNALLQDKESNNMLVRMNDQVQRLNYIVKDLLDVTRIEGNQVMLRKDEFDFTELITQTVEELQRNTTTHRIEIETYGQPVLHADKERTSQVLINLLSNAIAYSPNGSDIIVTTYQENEAIICSVKDFGRGIHKDNQTKIFERFYRATDKSKFNAGLGLGLYISSQIMKRQDGKLWVESEPDKGATFYFSLPLTAF